MSEKPRFWDYFWASHVGNSYLIMRDRKSRTEKVYYRTNDKKGTLAVLTLGIVIVLFASLYIIDDFILRFNLEYDLIIIISLTALILSILSIKYSYKSANFEEIYGQEMQEILEKKKKFLRLRRSVFIIFIVLAYGFLLINSYSITYLRFLADGGQSASSVSVSIKVDEKNVQLSNAVVEEAVLDISGISKKEQVAITVYVAKAPDDISVFLNGKEIESQQWKIGSFIWEDEYFKSETYCYTTVGELAGINTLLIKSGGFKKEWTFKTEVAGQ